MRFLNIFLIFVFLHSSNGGPPPEILGVLPFDSTSHFVVGETIMKSLAEFYHNVTVISPRPQKKKIELYNDISIADGTSNFEFGNGKDI